MQLWGNDIATSWGTVIMEPFEWGLPAIQIDVSGFSMAKDSQTSKFAAFEQFKIESCFANFGQVQGDTNCSPLLTLGRSQLFY